MNTSNIEKHINLLNIGSSEYIRLNSGDSQVF